MLSSEYPQEVRPQDVVNQYFGNGLFRVKGGKAVYDEVWMADGGKAVYLIRLIMPETAWTPVKILKRWIPWETVLIMTYDPQDDYK